MEQHLCTGSKSVEKVKEALHGKHGQNLDDVDHMTGTFLTVFYEQEH